MTALAAARLGYRCVVLAPEPAAPASDVVSKTIQADYLDPAALRQFADLVDVVTLEFENVPAAALEILAEQVPVRPGAAALSVAQDRLREKRAAEAAGAAVAPYQAVDDVDGLQQALAAIGCPAVLKSRRMGYDGKGQVLLDPNQPQDAASLTAVWQTLGGTPAILEGFVDFDGEISVIVARTADGRTAAYDPVWNVHQNHILHTTTVPAPIPASQAAAATATALALAERLELVGLLAVEMFVGADGQLLVNELAPRPHNSGHWTMDGAATCQFEQLVRAICTLPLGDPAALGRAKMLNLLGDDSADVTAYLADAEAHVHLYGKAEARPGRKMGHVNWLYRTGRDQKAGGAAASGT